MTTMVETEDRSTFTESVALRLFEIENGGRIRVCLQCGACTGTCPLGHLMKYPPHKMIAALRAGMFETIVESDSAWLCVSCQACAEVCPADIPLTVGLMTTAKEELLLAGKTPVELQDALEKTQRYGNSLGESPRKRADWVDGLEPAVTLMRKADRAVEVLWFVGDYASYHPRVRQTARAMARVLQALEVDFGILGPEETSDADSQRLAGERGLFEMQADKNASVLARYEFDEIITTDPHTYNALKNEYPRLGISYPVRHYTEYLAANLDRLLPLLVADVSARIAYHDPCYLGRANGIYEEPRLLLRSLPGAEMVEMAHTRDFSVCCGGGGGGMWLDGFLWEKGKVRPAEWRVNEAVAVGADILAIACPPEAPRFEDAIKTIEGAERLVVKDIAELLVDAMGMGE